MDFSNEPDIIKQLKDFVNNYDDISTWSIALFTDKFFKSEIIANSAYDKRRIAIMNKITEFETIENNYVDELLNFTVDAHKINRCPTLTKYFKHLRDRPTYNEIIKDVSSINDEISEQTQTLSTDLKNNLIIINDVYKKKKELVENDNYEEAYIVAKTQDTAILPFMEATIEVLNIFDERLKILEKYI